MPGHRRNLEMPALWPRTSDHGPMVRRRLRKLDVEGRERGRALYRNGKHCVRQWDNAEKSTFNLPLAELEGGNDGQPVISEFVGCWQLLPASSAKPQPDYIPEALRGDYEEVCAIRDASPRPLATITRRCIQGIIRDFCGINKRC